MRIWVRGEAETPSVGGGEAGGGSSWWLKWRGERERKNAETWADGWFLADFGPDFLLPRAMKCSPIYRRWKRNMLSLMVLNRGLWFGWYAS